MMLVMLAAEESNKERRATENDVERQSWRTRMHMRYENETTELERIKGAAGGEQGDARGRKRAARGIEKEATKVRGAQKTLP